MENKTTNKFQPQGRVKNINGSILTPENGGLRFVLSLANMAGKPEGNPLLPLFDKKWAMVRAQTKGAFANKTGEYKLGKMLSPVATQSDVWIIPMLVQDEDLKTDVKALETCLKAVCASAKYERASIHVSSILTDAIPELTSLITTHLVEEGVSVCYYQERQ